MTLINYKYENSDDFLADSIDAIESFIAYQLEHQEIVRIALSGGNSPRRVYSEISQSEDIDWRRIEIFLVDERYVSTNSPDSNLHMIEQTILRRTPNIRAVHFFDTELPIEEAAEKMNHQLGQMESPRFDLVILGLGDDGHTASLFPGIPELEEKNKMAIHTIAKGQKIEDRLTLTFPAIMDSERIMFLIRGKNKTAVVEKLIEGNANPKKIPAARVLNHPHVEIYFDASQ